MTQAFEQAAIGPSTLADQVYGMMRDLIIRGEFAPGTRLVQRQLAKQFGVSSIPVLEAIRRLERDGLVTSHPRYGAQVETWTREDIEGAYLMREALEGTACRLFAERATDTDRFVLEEYGREYQRAIEEGKEREACEVDIALHQHIIRCTRSRVFARLAENSCVITTTIRNVSRICRADAPPLPPKNTHDALIAVLLRRDPALAEQAGKLHVRDSLVRLLAQLAPATPEEK